MCIVLLWWKLSIFTHLLQQRKVKVGNLGQWNSKHTLRLFTFKTAIICYVKGPFFYVSKLYASRSVQFSCSVVSGSLRHHGLQHARLPCLSLTPRACSNSCPLTWWCHPTILCSVIPFSCLRSFPASGSFLMSQFFASDSQRWRFSISPSNEYSGLISFRIDWVDLLTVQGTLKSLLQHHSSKASVLWCSAFSMVQLSHPYMTTGKIIALTIQAFVG